MQVARQWDIERKVTTLTTISAGNTIKAAQELPVGACLALPIASVETLTLPLQNSAVDSTLAKCSKVIGRFKHGPANAAELKQQETSHGQKKDSLTHRRCQQGETAPWR